MKKIINKLSSIFNKKETIEKKESKVEEPRKYGPLYQYRTNVKN
jgi:hypothetical protein